MRTKALLGLAVLAAGTLASTAQTSVYSLNVVGYYTVTIPAGKYGLIANQMVGTNYSVASVLNVPEGTTLYKWNGSGLVGYAINTFSGGLWDDDTMTLGPGEATFVKNPSTTAPLTLTFVGEVNQNTNTQTLKKGYSMVSLFTPQTGALLTDFKYAPPQPTDHSATTIYKWNLGGVGYSVYNYIYDTTLTPPAWGWESDEPSLNVGEGFFVKSPADHTWTRSFTVQ